jgi:hypothetical protein
MSAVPNAGYGGGFPPAPPPPPGSGGGDRRRPGGGSGGRGSNKKQRRAAKRRGRPLQSMERMQIMGIWYQLTTSARRSLWESLGEMLGESQVGGPIGPAVPTATGPTEAAPRRTRVWEREILRDVPLFSEYGNLTTRERREDTRAIPRLFSIAQGVVARGRAQHVTGGEITTAIIANLGNADHLQALYGGPPVMSSSDNDEGSAAPANADTDENMDQAPAGA